MPRPSPSTSPASGKTLEQRITEVGATLRDALTAVLDALPPGGPQPLATHLSLDKVLMSRLLKATRHRDPVAVVYYSPGPEPLRRFVKAARKVGVKRGLLTNAEQAITEFSDLVRKQLGDRSALDALVSAWLPETRAEFELRRKQAAYRATSQLKGISCDISLSTVFLHPSGSDGFIDIVWLMGLLGLQRLRPGAVAKFATKRMVEGPDGPRVPTSLDGRPIDLASGLGGMGLDRFCDAPPAGVEVIKVGESMHYVLAGDAYGPGTAVDLLTAEVNLGEMPRYVPAGSERKGYVFSQVSAPCRTLLFDVLVHPDIYPDSFPQLMLYETILDGIADVNDRSRDMDRLELSESIQHLPQGVANHRVAGIPHYVDLLRHVTDSMDWPTDGFRGYRCRIDYPVYGQQVVMAFAPPAPPES